MVQDLAVSLFHLLECMACIKGCDWNIAAINLYSQLTFIHKKGFSFIQFLSLVRMGLPPKLCCNCDLSSLLTSPPVYP